MADAPPTVVELRPMGIGDILDATFRLYKTSFAPFLVIALVAYLPYALYTLGVGLMYEPPAMQMDPYAQTTEADYWAAGEQSATPTLLFGIGNFVFLVIVLPLAQAALVYNISGVILGERVSAGTAFGRAAGRFLPLFFTQFLAGIVIGFGLLLLIVPGIIFSLWFMLVAPVVVLERTGGTRAMSRSRELMRGNLGKGFMLYLVVAVLGWVVGIGAAVVFDLLPLPHEVFVDVGILLAQALVLPIQTAPVILLYYELRVRKEAFDLQRLAESVGYSQESLPVG